MMDLHLFVSRRLSVSSFVRLVRCFGKKILMLMACLAVPPFLMNCKRTKNNPTKFMQISKTQLTNPKVDCFFFFARWCTVTMVFIFIALNVTFDWQIAKAWGNTLWVLTLSFSTLLLSQIGKQMHEGLDFIANMTFLLGVFQALCTQRSRLGDDSVV